MNKTTISVNAPFPEDADCILIDPELILLNPLRRLMADGTYREVTGSLAVIGSVADLAAASRESELPDSTSDPPE